MVHFESTAAIIWKRVYYNRDPSKLVLQENALIN